MQLNLTKIKSSNLGNAVGFSMFTPSNSYYYDSDASLSSIFILNENWSYVSSKTFSLPMYLTTIGSSLFATEGGNIWKLDQNLNVLIQYTASGTAPSYAGIYYSSSNDFIYVVPAALTKIHVFDRLSIIVYQSIFKSSFFIMCTTSSIFIIFNHFLLVTLIFLFLG